ncbi:hypothetical protein ONS95_013447 [Cadophora gregata]|uniref:uncharacterized protein n=1 Tax=Cadophora gregata TaxID=51156 RepID=UPI0026DAFE03|nr:uncharacterized protein ONS95_013447 [Cadophora gregata]KAK0116429.1 hypothetical protein ONS95_013447 [Cadophora gregata]
MRLSFLLASLACLLSLSVAQSIGAFYTGGGPTVIKLNGNSGNFSYNVYKATGFSDEWSSFAPTFPPVNGTPMAVTGFSSPSAVYGSVFYQTRNNSLSQQLFKCWYSSGDCLNYGGFIISSKVTVPVKQGTGLSVALLSTNFGYRVTYEDIHGSIRQLSYSNTTEGVVTYWNDGALVKNGTTRNSSALATTYLPSVNDTIPAEQTIYQVSDDQILSVTNKNTTFINQTSSWSQGTTLPAMPNWSPESGKFSTILYNSWNMLFYIDTNRQLQWVWSNDGAQTWHAQPLMETSTWPLADTPNAPVAATTSVNASDNSASVFYISNGKMIQSVMTNWSWAPYSIVQAPLPSNITEIISRPNNSRTITIGASTGVSVGFLIVVAVAAWYIKRRKQALQRAALEYSNSESRDSWKENEFAYQGGKAELSGLPSPRSELDHDPDCKLLHQLQVQRMYEATGIVPAELQNCETKALELDHTHCKYELDASLVCELPAGRDDEKRDSEINSSETQKREGSESHVSVKEGKELPHWSWDILRRERKKQDSGTESLDLERG